MKIDWSFPKQILISLIVVGVLALYPLIALGSTETITAVLVGALLSTVNVLLGFAAIEYAFDKSATTFLKVVLGGMGIRLTLLLAVIAILIKTSSLQLGIFVTSLGVFYVLFLILEILFIQKKMDIRKP